LNEGFEKLHLFVMSSENLALSEVGRVETSLTVLKAHMEWRARIL
jgi:hypothetical protein